MKKRNHKAERDQAAKYADKIMNAVSDEDITGWTQSWGRVYRAYLAGLRSALRR